MTDLIVRRLRASGVTLACVLAVSAPAFAQGITTQPGVSLASKSTTTADTLFMTGIGGPPAPATLSIQPAVVSTAQPPGSVLINARVDVKDMHHDVSHIVIMCGLLNSAGKAIRYAYSAKTPLKAGAYKGQIRVLSSEGGPTVVGLTKAYYCNLAFGFIDGKIGTSTSTPGPGTPDSYRPLPGAPYVHTIKGSF
jgi:F0F1-type ATP synthase membrane subunit c/vacuolar-type H+-ATPase subunit K